ncbi:MAG: hydroxyacid dehydrogenase [Firmicutes bacterium]|nr:hydroxyacid dehydrogenase [Bacillota bacterium]
MKKKVLIVQPIHESGVEVLEPYFDVKVASDPSIPTLLREIDGAHGAIVRTAPFPAEVIDKARDLEVIARHGVGVDNIDVEAATSRGIPVVYTPNANAVSVVEHVIMFMGALAKVLLPYDKATREDNFGVRNEYRAVDINGKTLGIVGVGRIGGLLCKKCMAAFDMRVLAYDPYVPAEKISEIGATPCNDLDELLRESDFVSLHLPLTDETRNLIGGRELALMKPTAFLINAARGGAVEEAALIDALTNRRIAGAALDVFEKEPPDPDNPLLKLDNVILTPHSGALTQEAVIRMATGAAEGVRDVLLGKRPQFVVNPQVFKGWNEQTRHVP